MHFTAATLTFSPQSLREAAEGLGGQRVLKCHILAGDYSTKGSKAFAVNGNSESSVNPYQHNSYLFPCVEHAASYAHHLSAVSTRMGLSLLFTLKARGAC